MSIIVTGHRGFIGQYVSNCLLMNGYDVIGIGSEANSLIPTLLFPQEVYDTKLPNDVLANLLTSRAIEAIIHCAGTNSVSDSVENPIRDFERTVPIVLNCLETIRLYSPQTKFLFISSAAVYGNPTRLPVKETDPLKPISPYGSHKLMCEMLCQEYSSVYGLLTAWGRIFSAYGLGLERQVIAELFNKFLTQSEQVMLQGEASYSRDFVHVKDVAESIRLILEKSDFNAEAYNIANGEEVTIGDLASKLSQLTGGKIPYCFDDIPIKGVPRQWRADIQKLKALGFSAQYHFSSGLEEILVSKCGEQERACQ